MSGFAWRRCVTSVAATVALSAAGCSNETEDKVRDAAESAADDAVELVARNFAAQQGDDAFADAGHALRGNLDCEADADTGLRNVTITCSGTTENGGEAVLDGTTSELPGESITELEGDFIGTVDGDEVFSTDKLGD